MANTQTRIAVIDVLSVGVALRLGPELVYRLEPSHASLRDKRLQPVD